MAILIEAWSVVVRRDAIEARFDGGWEGFLRAVPNRSLCLDAKLARVAFMALSDAEAYVGFLASHGLIPTNDTQWLDMVVLNHVTGLEEPAPWLKTSTTTLKPGQIVLVAWLPIRADTASVTYLPTDFAAPPGWTYETSLYANSSLVTDVESDRYKLLRHENGQDVFLDTSTGKEFFVARA